MPLTARTAEPTKMPPEEMRKINDCRKTCRMRPKWHMGGKGIMMVVRVCQTNSAVW